MITARDVARVASETGFRSEVVEKVLHLHGILDRLDRHEITRAAWLLKGGTALNLLHLDVPRLVLSETWSHFCAGDRLGRVRGGVRSVHGSSGRSRRPSSLFSHGPQMSIVFSTACWTTGRSMPRHSTTIRTSRSASAGSPCWNGKQSMSASIAGIPEPYSCLFRVPSSFNDGLNYFIHRVIYKLVNYFTSLYSCVFHHEKHVI